jgi:hypothetical protein
MELSDAERKRRSELAKSLHKKGRFGGAQKGSGRPKKERAQEAVAEMVKEDATEIYKAMKAALKSDSPSVRLKAALAMLEIETKEEEFKIKKEQREFDNLSKEKMLELIQERVKQLKDQGFDINMLEVIEGQAAEIKIPPKEIESGD